MKESSEKATYNTIPKQNYGGSKKISGFQGLREGINRENTKDFLESENALYDTTCVQTHRLHNTESSLMQVMEFELKGCVMVG